MEYDSRPKLRLFTLKDKNEETKELFFVGRKVMAGLGIVFGIAISGIVFFFSENILISLGIGIAAGLPSAFFPVYADIKRQEYFAPLIDKIIELLNEFGIELNKQETMDLLSFKEFRINDEHVLVAMTKNGELEISVATDILKEETKQKKSAVFPVVVNSKAESDVKPKVETKPEEVFEEAPEVDPVFEEAPEAGIIQEEVPEAKSDTIQVHDSLVTKGNVKVSAVVTAGKEYTATSTDAMSIVSPLTSQTPVIGEIAPGVTGPIPLTVGDGSIVYEDSVAPLHNFGNHAEPYAPISTEEPPAKTKGRHGRRSAASSVNF